MKPKIILSVLVLLAIAFTLTPNPCLSAVPSLINYQGVLKDSLGVPQNGNFPMKFSIYNDSTGGNKLWEEIHMAVEVKNGLFNVLLGSSSDKGPIPDSVFASPNTWFEVQVFGSVLTPRRRIVSVGYALHSEFTDTADYARFAPDVDWQIDTSGFNIFRMTGNVGIGTTNPADILDITKNATFDVFLRTLMDNGDPRLAFVVPNAGGLGRNGGGINFRLDTGTNVAAIGASANVGNIANAGALSFYTNDGTTVAINLYIERNGNVGIGTTNPQEKLDVEGNVQAYAFNVGDIFFKKDKEKLWRMFEDNEGLYLENLKTGKIFRFILQEVEKK